MVRLRSCRTHKRATCIVIVLAPPANRLFLVNTYSRCFTGVSARRKRSRPWWVRNNASSLEIMASRSGVPFTSENGTSIRIIGMGCLPARCRVVRIVSGSRRASRRSRPSAAVICEMRPPCQAMVTLESSGYRAHTVSLPVSLTEKDPGCGWEFSANPIDSKWCRMSLGGIS